MKDGWIEYMNLLFGDNFETHNFTENNQSFD